MPPRNEYMNPVAKKQPKGVATKKEQKKIPLSEFLDHVKEWTEKWKVCNQHRTSRTYSMIHHHLLYPLSVGECIRCSTDLIFVSTTPRALFSFDFLFHFHTLGDVRQEGTKGTRTDRTNSRYVFLSFYQLHQHYYSYQYFIDYKLLLLSLLFLLSLWPVSLRPATLTPNLIL